MTKNYPMAGSLPMAASNKFLDAVNTANGSRNAGIVIGGDGAVDWNKYGPFCIVEVGEKGQVDILAIVDYERATHTRHKASKHNVPISQLGVPAIGPDWSLEYNYDQEKTCLTNNKRISITLWDDFKDIAWFAKLDDRITLAYGSDEWTSSFGDAHKTKADEAKAQLARTE